MRGAQELDFEGKRKSLFKDNQNEKTVFGLPIQLLWSTRDPSQYSLLLVMKVVIKRPSLYIFVKITIMSPCIFQQRFLLNCRSQCVVKALYCSSEGMQRLNYKVRIPIQPKDSVPILFFSFQLSLSLSIGQHISVYQTFFIYFASVSNGLYPRAYYKT